MKKIYLLIIVLCVSISAIGQVILTKSVNQPVLGNVNTKQLYDSVGIVPKNIGANQVWDFSSFTASSSTEISNFIAPSAAPGGSSYTGTSFVESYGSGNYFYMKASTTKYELVGVQTPSFKLNFSANNATQFIWPITMGYSQSDAFSGTANASNTNGTVTGNITTLGCGTGTLILPDGTSYHDVLQVKMTLTAHASFLFGLTTVDLKAVDYMYYDSINKFPLLRVTYSDVTGSYTSKSADVKVNSAIVGINDLNLDASFTVFPNPANDNFYVNLYNATNAYCTVEIINAMGQSIQINHLGSDIHISDTISISNLTSGMYFVKITLGDKVSVRKLIKE